MIIPAPTRVPYYPLETVESYLRRLCTANHMNPDSVRRALNEGASMLTCRRRSELIASRLEEMGGLAAGTLDADRDDDSSIARSHPHCHQCQRADRPRWLCVQCAKGQQVHQIPHHRTTLCLTHRRWTGPGTPWQLHTRVDHPNLIRAERLYRRHRYGWCPTNVITARTIAADWALHTDPVAVARRREVLTITHLPPDIQLEIWSYPEAVALMGVFADSSWITDTLRRTQVYREIRAAVHARIIEVFPEHTDHAAAQTMHALKPAIARYMHTHGRYRGYSQYPDNPALPIWHHDIEIMTAQ